jgi:hypothetical protein
MREGRAREPALFHVARRVQGLGTKLNSTFGTVKNALK